MNNFHVNNVGNGGGCSTLCIVLITLFAVFSIALGCGFFNKQNIIVVSSPSSSTSSPPIGSVPITVPTRCWGRDCGSGIAINPDLRNTHDIFNDPYIPPVKTNDYTYRQIGILTSMTDNLILPLLGKQHINGRDKWNYYTISNTGSINTKLPIRVHGKPCTNEYGCDQIYTGDVVFVEGYDRKFKANVYENNTYSYDPSL